MAMRAEWLATGLATGLLLAGCGSSSTSSTATTSTSGTTTTFTQPTTSTNTHTAKTKTVKVPPPEGRSPGDTVGTVLSSSAPNLACGILVTVRYVTKSFGGIKGCVGAVQSGASATVVKVGNVAVSGDAATVKAVATGGASEGEKLTVRLVREPVPSNATLGRIWRVDSVHSNVPVGP